MPRAHGAACFPATHLFPREGHSNWLRDTLVAKKQRGGILKTAASPQSAQRRGDGTQAPGARLPQGHLLPTPHSPSSTPLRPRSPSQHWVKAGVLKSSVRVGPPPHSLGWPLREQHLGLTRTQWKPLPAGVGSRGRLFQARGLGRTRARGDGGTQERVQRAEHGHLGHLPPAARSLLFLTPHRTYADIHPSGPG